MTPPTLSRLALAAALLALAAAPARSQGFDMSKGGDQQIQVFADSGIEWHSEELRVIARGNAHAVRGNITVDADVLTAHYRKGAKGDEIWRLDADGNVTIRSPNDTATGHKAVYDLDKSIFVLRGAPAKLATPSDTFTATESLEYWETKKMAVLRGDATASQQGGKTLKADTLTAHFMDKDKSAGKTTGAGQQGSGNGLELQRVDAYGHVTILSGGETVTGDRGDYNAETGIATVSGSVKISREGGNQLEGGWAHVNLNTGVSKLFPVAAGGTDSGQRVQGVFIPQKKGDTGEPQGRAGFSGSVPTPRTGER